MIISFSGLDGAGKTTQIGLLLDAYRNQGANVGSIYSYMPDIRYHNTKELCELYEMLLPFDVIHIRYRLNSDRNCAIMRNLECNIPPQRLLATAAAIQGYIDHIELTKFVLDPLLNKKKILIFDRYYYDELVFKYIYGCPEYILKMLYSNKRDADIGFFVKISSEECMRRNKSRPDSAVAVYQSQASIDSLADRFDFISKQNRLVVLDGMLPKEELARSVLTSIDRLNLK